MRKQNELKSFFESDDSDEAVKSEDSSNMASLNRRTSLTGFEILSIGDTSSSDKLSNNDVRHGVAVLVNIQEVDDLNCWCSQ